MCRPSGFASSAKGLSLLFLFDKGGNERVQPALSLQVQHLERDESMKNPVSVFGYWRGFRIEEGSAATHNFGTPKPLIKN
jgi:hypothetical protein